MNRNWSQIFSMGGYGFYVWGSYITALILLGGEILSLRRRKRASGKCVNPDQG